MADILDLSEVKDHLNITSSANDAELARFNSAATAFVERHVGPVAQRTVVETVTPLTGGLIYLSAPVISITSMVAAYGYPGTYTVGNWTPDGYGIRAAYGLGTSYLSSPVTITYVGGYVDVPADLREAILDYVKWRWESQRGSTPLAAMGGEFAVAPTATVPYKIMEVIDGYRQVVIA